MNDYVSKPIKPNEIYAAIDRGLGGNMNPTRLMCVLKALTETSLLSAAMAIWATGQQTMPCWSVSGSASERDSDGCCGEECRKTVPGCADTIKSLLAIFHGEKARRIALDIEQAAKQSAVDWVRCQNLAADFADEMARLKPDGTFCDGLYTRLTLRFNPVCCRKQGFEVQSSG